MLLVDAYSLKTRLNYSQLKEEHSGPAFMFSLEAQYPRKFLDKIKHLGFQNQCFRSTEAMYAQLALTAVDLVSNDTSVTSATIVSQHGGVIPVLWYLVKNTALPVTYISKIVPDSLAKLLTFEPCGKYLFEKEGEASEVPVL